MALRCFLFLLSAAAGLAQEIVDVPEPAARFTTLPGYVPVPPGVYGKAWKWEKPPEGPCGRPIRLLVYGEHDPVSQSREGGIDPALKSAGFKFEWPTVEWKGFKVPIELRPEKPENGRLQLVVDLPLAKHGLRIEMSVPRDRLGEAARDLKVFVGSVEGRPGWLTPSETKQKWVGALCGMIGIPSAWLYFLTWLTRWRGKPGADSGLRMVWLLATGLLLLGTALFERTMPEGKPFLKSPALIHGVPMLIGGISQWMRLRGWLRDEN